MPRSCLVGTGTEGLGTSVEKAFLAICSVAWIEKGLVVVVAAAVFAFGGGDTVVAAPFA